MEIITAKQARELTLETSQENFELLMFSIKRDAEEGFFRTFTPTYLNDEHLGKLRELGYEYKVNDHGIEVRW